MIEIERYQKHHESLWNDAVRASRNGTFLHLRPYMDYHVDRFGDFSLIARSQTGHVLAVLPAEASGRLLRSHGGLTYGGWIMSGRVSANIMLEIWEAFCRYAVDNGFDTLIYKPVPHIYHRYPAEEDLYCLFRSRAVLEASQVSSVIDMEHSLAFDQNARRGLAKARKAGLEVAQSSDFAAYWDILESVLAERHGVRPVHSLAEIEMLAARFPQNIKLYGVYSDGKILAGTVLYLTDTTVHAQYIASGQQGRSAGALALLFSNLISQYSTTHRYFDFGTSNEQSGQILNAGLVRQKSGFGARAVVYNTYKVDLKSSTLAF